MCTAFAVLLTAALMRSTNRLPIIRMGMMPEPLAVFSGLAEPKASLLFHPCKRFEPLCLEPHAIQRHGYAVSLSGLAAFLRSRPNSVKAARAGAVNTGRKATAARGAKRC